MANHQPVKVDPKEEKRAQDMWASFTVISKYSIIIIVGILVLLCAAFIK